MSQKAIAEELINKSGIDLENETYTNILTNEVNKIIKQTKSEIINSENNQTNENKITSSPIRNTTESWKLSDTGDMFSENISQEGFMAAFNSLSESTDNNSYFSQYIDAINNIGADNFFNTLDSDKDGVLAKSELDILLNNDGDETNISSDEFNDI